MTFAMYLDENVDVEVAVRLRRDGYDVATTQEVGLVTAADDVQLAYATQQMRVLVTHDLKTIPPLVQAWWAAGREHAGIVLCAFRAPGEIHESLRVLLESYDSADMRNVTRWLPQVGHTR